VDFAKHGKAVEKDRYIDFQKMLNEDKLPGQYPDYLNKGDGESLREFYESSLILGKLYREVRIDRHHERILLDDFEVSILLKYELMPGIIKRGYEVS